jgi:hypothetical protein
VRVDQLEPHFWQEVRTLLQEPQRLLQGYQRRLQAQIRRICQSNSRLEEFLTHVKHNLAKAD